MYTQQPKKLLIINILDILKRYSDEDHRLSQRDIVEILENEYQMKADRKAIKRNLLNLIDFGYRLEYSESVRLGKDGAEEIVYSDWYLERDFSDAELRLLVDSLLFSKHIPYSQCKQLIGKLEGLSNQYFRAKVKHICNLPEDQPHNSELFYTIEILDEAIEKKRQVEFNYADHGLDHKLHLRLNDAGQPRSYAVNPYQMVATNGRYYLIGNYDKYDNISHYRIDRIKNIRLMDSPAKPQRQVQGLEHGLNLPRHMAEHIYMFSGESARVTLLTDREMAGELIDWFGNGVSFSEAPDGKVQASVTANLQAMRYWALQYAPYVQVTEPPQLVELVKGDLDKALSHYMRETPKDEETDKH